MSPEVRCSGELEKVIAPKGTIQAAHDTVQRPPSRDHMADTGLLEELETFATRPDILTMGFNPSAPQPFEDTAIMKTVQFTEGMALVELIKLKESTLPDPDEIPVKVLKELAAWPTSASSELAQRLDNLPIADAAAAENASVENRWCQLRDTVQSTALAILGRAPRQHQDWFADNDAAISNLLAEKNRLHKAYVDHPTDENKAAFYRSCRHIQQRLREMQNAWTACKAEEIQGYKDRNEWKNFFSGIKAVCCPPTRGTAPLLSADGRTLLTEKIQILQR
nr:unnamed protein product [Spirometra erinaceieuropaei]